MKIRSKLIRCLLCLAQRNKRKILTTKNERSSRKRKKYRRSSSCEQKLLFMEFVINFENKTLIMLANTSVQPFLYILNACLIIITLHYKEAFCDEVECLLLTPPVVLFLAYPT